MEQHPVTEIDRSSVDTTAPPGESETSDAEVATRGTTKERGRRTRRAVIEWAILIGSALLIALLIKTYLFQAFYIPSESMVPTLNVGDRVLVNKLSYKLHDVHRGDIVVFTTPQGEDASKIKDLVKRVIALPGETIESRNGRIYINGRLLEEPYVKRGVLTCGNSGGTNGNCDDIPQFKIHPGQYWVMGDNRTKSKDSRFFSGHTIKESSIVGRVFIRIWPLTHIGFL